ncbi:citrate synthase [bacterium]|nr:citrate synthase [bacterium]
MDIIWYNGTVMTRLQSIIKQLSDDIVQTYGIPDAEFSRLSVKRGLRNADGTGVLAGLTRVSSVKGVEKTAHGVQPCHGVLTYRGLSLDELVRQLSPDYQFEQTVFLLLVGRLPKPDELADLVTWMAENRQLDPAIIQVIQNHPSTSVMNTVQTVVSLLYTVDKHPLASQPDDLLEKSLGIIAKFPMIVAYAYLSNANGKSAKYVTPTATMGTAEAFLYMLHEGKPVQDLDKKTLDLTLVIHAEHGGGNNSSFTTRVIASSASDLYSTLAGAIGSLKGPLHGAANQKVCDMIDHIQATLNDWDQRSAVCDYLKEILEKKAYDKSGKIYGLGHAVYTLSDPRAILIKEKADQLAIEYKKSADYQLYLTIESEGPRLFQTVKKTTKIISPNVDFFSGFVYQCLGIPVPVFTSMFAMARVSGWCTHYIEEGLSGRRIIRPKYQYVS